MLVVLRLVSAARTARDPILICPESSMALKGAILGDFASITVEIKG